MNGCNYIKQRIDEAEKPDLLPFDVSEHIGQCVDCERFARERTSLRELLAGGARVSAPLNFDAMLRARLAERRIRPAFWWLGSPGLLRLGAATAGLVIVVSVAQYAGLFSSNETSRPDGAPLTEVVPQTIPFVPQTTPLPLPPAPPAVVASGPQYSAPYVPSKVKRGTVLSGGEAPAGYMTAEDGGVLLVRGGNGDIDVPMPTVSVGAQPLLYVSAGQRTVRNVGTSF
jgi:hypothetical protein